MSVDSIFKFANNLNRFKLVILHLVFVTLTEAREIEIILAVEDQDGGFCNLNFLSTDLGKNLNKRFRDDLRGVDMEDAIRIDLSSLNYLVWFEFIPLDLTKIGSLSKLKRSINLRDRVINLLMIPIPKCRLNDYGLAVLGNCCCQKLNCKQ